MGLSACAPPGFSGDAGTIYFTSSLSRDYQAFRPWQPVAQGTHLSFQAVQVMPYTFFSPTDPNAIATETGAALTTEVVLTNQWSGWAAAAGNGALSWSGVTADAFVLDVAPAQSIELVDPLAYYADEGDTPHHPAFAAVGHQVVMAPGAWLNLEVVPRSVGGVALAYEPGWISVDGGVEFEVAPGGHGVDIFSPAAGPATSTFTLSAGDSGVSETFTVIAPVDPAAEVTRLELAAPEVVISLPTAYFVVVATAYRADGGVLWVPPVKWQLPPEVLDLQAKNKKAVQVPLPYRNDVRVLALEASSAVVSVSYAGLDASVTLALPLPVADAGAPAVILSKPGPPAPGTACGGCTSGSGMLGALALLLLGARPRRL